MAIIFPPNIVGKGVTAGSLRQLKQKGYSESTGLWSTKYIAHPSQIKFSSYFYKQEPGGQLMDYVSDQKKQFEEMTEAMRNSMHTMVETSKETSKTLHEASGKIRDGTDKLAVALDKYMKVAGKGDFAKTVELTESLVSAMERLAVLEEKGLLDKVIKAMTAH